MTATLDEALHADFGARSFQAEVWNNKDFAIQATAASPTPNSSIPATASAAPAAPAASAPPAATGKENSASTPTTAAAPAGPHPVSVYVVPIKDEINTPQMYVLRRALKDAIENHVDAIVLDMDTYGGEMMTTVDMMEALSKFQGRTYTYVDTKAVSAGSYIAVATDEIYFAPGGRIGAAAVVTGEGGDLDDTMKTKVDSFMRASVRAVSGNHRYRADVQRAMMDSAFVFKIGDKVIKPAGELLSLTATEACQTYGSPPETLLGAGIAPDIDSLLTQLYGKDGFVVKDFHLTWSEYLAKWLNSISALLLGAGILLLFIEFKSSTFGVAGVIGVFLLLLVFASQYIAGLAGYEPVVLFVLGIALLLVELFFFPGSVVCGLLGAAFFFAAFVWAMTDVWPGESHGGVTISALTQPLINVMLGFALAIIGFIVALRFLPQTRYHSIIVNQSAVPRDSLASSSGAAIATGAVALPDPGAQGLAMTDLRPLGEIEIAGGRFQARALHGQIVRGTPIEVVSRKDFALAVRPLQKA